MKRGLALLWLLGAGCSSPATDGSGLPPEPIAFMYRTVEETGRVLQAAQAAKDQAGGGAAGNESEVRLRGVERLLERSADSKTRDEEGSAALFVASAGRLERLDNLPSRTRPIAWSPDHERLMVASITQGTAYLSEWNATTGEVRRLTSGNEVQFDGSYGPDGAIAYVQSIAASQKDDRTKIWVRWPGQVPRAVTEGPYDLQPTWSPDGARLVFTSRNQDWTRLELRWVDPTSGEGGSLGMGRSPAFSPDGRWVAYSGHSADGWKIRIMHPDGTGKRSLGRSGYQENEPSFSPDGLWVVFSAKKELTSAVSNLFVRSLDGKTDRQLPVSGSGWQPVW